MKDEWDNRVTMKENMAAMGVALNANDVMPFAGTKKGMIDKMKKQKNVPIKEQHKPEVTKPEVITQLQKEANVAAKQSFRFTTTQVQLITYMMDKHGMDFNAMSRDAKNHYQETTAKLRGMVTKFISIPEHYAPYCKERGLITPSENTEEKKEDMSEDESESEEKDVPGSDEENLEESEEVPGSDQENLEESEEEGSDSD